MSQDTLVHDDNGAVDPTLPPDPSRRFWVTTACAAGGAAGVAVAIPFVSTFAPSERARAAGAPVEVDIADLAPGQMRTVEWRGKPVWIIRRTEEQIKGLTSQDSLLADPKSDRPGFTPEYAKNETRSRKPELFVCVGICTHLGCSPTPHFETGGGAGMPSSWEGGFLCPCHGSTFDLAGRVYRNKPAPDNLEVPPYQYMSDTRIIVGVDEDNKA
ncbi:ubiquinol-cytochrome C reductase iron-sulfur subunit [Bordetella ansorpii]|uniref:Ubiquinol-cytochrome c reductase iron-sulfur subunit n=1 Tax=Bordetella ansorpii TaxID=288768 RepID=A0A157KS77_9BORD|nr:ubiquinol-cytochrome c reductase iron-sulfur subunit [Bordetella ansorpii]SAH87377.1 ubiquinol-cytochrome C reductase iron-sulfur subunit [Bordetella ansorpii]